MIIQVIMNSLVLGLTYVLMASGLTLVFGIMRIVNFTHGQMYMLGSFVLYCLAEEAGPIMVPFPPAITMMTAMPV